MPYYVYINIHKPSGFDCKFLYCEGMGIYNDADDYSCVYKDGYTNPNIAALAGEQIEGEFTSETDFEAIIRLQKGYILELTDEEIEELGLSLERVHKATDEAKKKSIIKDGEYSFRIYGLTEAIPLDEPNEEKKLWFEKGSRIDCISYSFTVDGDGIPAIPTQTLAVEHEFEVDGYKFVIDKMVASPMGIDITITDRLHQDIDMDGMHFNAINLLCHYSFSKEFDAINNPYSFEERMEFQKFLEEHDLVEGIYEIAVELDDEAKKYWHGGNRTWNYIKDENGDCNSIIMHILFKGPVYEDEILAVGFTKRYFDQMHLESYGHNPDVEIWRKND